MMRLSRRLVATIIVIWHGAAQSASAVHAGDIAAGADRRRVEAAVREVLNLREFRHLSTDRIGWWEALKGWLIDLLRSIGDAMDGLPSWAWWLVVIWLVLALLAILGHLAYTIFGLFGARGRSGARRDSAVAGDGEVYGIRELDFESVYRRAGEFVTKGDWGAAARYLYAAAILRLDRHGLLAFRASKTNADYVQELGAAPHRQSEFRSMTGRFEAIVYGGDVASATVCRQMQALVESWQHETADH